MTCASEMGARIMFHVGGIAALTLLVNATTAAPLLRYLGLARIAVSWPFKKCPHFWEIYSVDNFLSENSRILLKKYQYNKSINKKKSEVFSESKKHNFLVRSILSLRSSGADQRKLQVLTKHLAQHTEEVKVRSSSMAFHRLCHGGKWYFFVIHLK